MTLSRNDSARKNNSIKPIPLGSKQFLRSTLTSGPAVVLWTRRRKSFYLSWYVAGWLINHVTVSSRETLGTRLIRSNHLLWFAFSNLPRDLCWKLNVSAALFSAVVKKKLLFCLVSFWIEIVSLIVSSETELANSTVQDRSRPKNIHLHSRKPMEQPRY